MKALVFLVVAFTVAGNGIAGESNRFLHVVQRYADTMLAAGRDTYGPQKSGLILSALDRMTLTPLPVRPAPPGGIRRGDRPGRAWTAMNGANPHLDQNLLRILYALTDITGDKRYAGAADEELIWFFNNAMSPKTSLLPWGEHLSWDVILDVPISGGDEMMHEFARPWMLWERCFTLVPGPSEKFALGLWEHQIANHKTGGFAAEASSRRPARYLNCRAAETIEAGLQLPFTISMAMAIRTSSRASVTAQTQANLFFTATRPRHTKSSTPLSVLEFCRP